MKYLKPMGFIETTCKYERFMSMGKNDTPEMTISGGNVKAFFRCI